MRERSTMRCLEQGLHPVWPTMGTSLLWRERRNDDCRNYAGTQQMVLSPTENRTMTQEEMDELNALTASLNAAAAGAARPAKRSHRGARKTKRRTAKVNRR